MTEPIHMVFINIIASLLLLSGVLFYRFVYPKKKINLFVLLLLISILPIISIFRPGDYESGDFNIHIYRMMSFFNSLKDGILIPSWASELNATYGNPLFLFNYTLPYYLICVLHFLGLSFIAATKLYLGFTLYASSIFMYLFAKEITKNKLAAFSSAIFYLFAPYHLIDVHFRATLGESTIFMLAPLLFLFLVKYSRENKFIYLALVSLLTYLLFLSHPLLAGVFIGIGILYIMFTEFNKKNIKSMLNQFISLLIGILIAGYIWAPFIIYSPFMYHFPSVENVGFYTFNLLFYSPWRYGLLFQGPNGELATIIGYVQLFILLISTILILTGNFLKKIKIQIIFWVLLFFLTLFMMNPAANTFWKFVPNIGSMLTQYSRLSLALSFFMSIIAGYFVLQHFKKEKIIYVLIILTIGSTILNWGHRRVIPQINDAVLKKNVPYSTLTEGPSYYVDTKWADPKNFWFSEVPKQHLLILKGSGYIKELSRTTTKHIYIVSASTSLKMRETTLYFPGWKVKANGKELIPKPGYRGIIEFYLPKGQQKVEIYYEDLNSVLYLKRLGIVATLIISLYIIISILQKRFAFRKRV